VWFLHVPVSILLFLPDKVDKFVDACQLAAACGNEFTGKLIMLIKTKMLSARALIYKLWLMPSIILRIINKRAESKFVFVILCCHML
jgi:hypothetical protein